MSEVRSFDNDLISMTTITKTIVIKGELQYSFQGSAFFYNEQSPAEPGKTGPQWYKLERHWLVTNRHVVLPEIDGVEHIPDEFTFGFRKINDKGVDWWPITLSKDELISKRYFWFCFIN